MHFLLLADAVHARHSLEVALWKKEIFTCISNIFRIDTVSADCKLSPMLPERVLIRKMNLSDPGALKSFTIKLRRARGVDPSNRQYDHPRPRQ